MSGYGVIHRVKESGAERSSIYSVPDDEKKAKTYSDLVRSYIERRRAELKEKNDASFIDLRFLDATGRNLNLSGVNLSHCDFTGANLTGAILSNCQVNKTIFRDAKLDDCSMQSMHGKGAVFDNSDITQCRMAGIVFDGASFVGARMKKGEFDSSSQFRSCNFNRFVSDASDMRNVVFSDPDLMFTRMLHTDLRGAKFLSPQLTIDGANTYQGKKIKKDIERYLPDRAAKMRLIGCKYNRETQIDPCYKGITYDRVADQIISVMGLCAAVPFFDASLDFAKEAGSTVVMPFLHHHAPNLLPSLTSGITTHLPHGVGLVLVGASASVGVGAAIGKHVLTEKSIKTLEKMWDEASGFVKKSVMWATNSASRIKDATLLLGDIKQMRMMYHALEKTSLGPQPGRIKAAFRVLKHSLSGNDDASAMVVCDRKNFARALNYLSVKRPAKDINLIMSPNVTGYSKKSPSVLNLNADGTAEAFWYSSDLAADRMTPLAIVRFDKSGEPIPKDSFIATAKDPLTPKEIKDGIMEGRHPTQSDLEGIYSKNLSTVMNGLRQRIMYSPQLDGVNFSYNPNTHYVEEGKKHTIIVRRLRKGEIDNPNGVAILTTKGKGFFLRQNKVLMTQDSEAIEKIKEKASAVRRGQAKRLSRDTVIPRHPSRIEPKINVPPQPKPENQARKSPSFDM